MPGIGMPAMLYLQEFCRLASQAFGATAYHVGSSHPGSGKEFRDVDVRVLIEDAEWERMGLGDPRINQANPKWSALVMAFSALGKQMTGLPIDFQLQPVGYANEQFGDKPRNPCGIWAEQRALPCPGCPKRES